MESTPGVFLKGYTYFQQKFDKHNTDVLQTGLFLEKTITIRGEKAAELFYNNDNFIRKGATPKRFKKTLLGQGGVQGLDEQAHLHRKKLFMQVMNLKSIGKLHQQFEKYWNEAINEWEKQDVVILFKEAEKILCRAACEWIGISLAEDEVGLRTKYLSQMIDGSGGVGIRHRKGRKARKKAEKWIIKLIEGEREKKSSLSDETILSVFSQHRDLKGKRPKKKIVAVEILNLLRPIVATARYITFAALALHNYPQYRERIKSNTNEHDLHFVQEVRRFYPFFPFVAARVKQDFDWQEFHFPKGRRVLLDLYATNHDEKIWANANAFYAERFENWNGSAYNLIPQGGGDFHKNHRCAGEWVTIDLTRVAVTYLVRRMSYKVPEQDLEIDMARIPAIPKSRFKIEDVRRIP